jgi:hypothetical protein
MLFRIYYHDDQHFTVLGSRWDFVDQHQRRNPHSNNHMDITGENHRVHCNDADVH